MRYHWFRRVLPRPVLHHVLHFEGQIEDAVTTFAAALAPQARVLDAGAGEGAYAPWFRAQRYVGVDLGVGDAGWDYGSLDAVADLTHLPFADSVFDACLNVVTLEHVREPAAVLRELARCLRPGGTLLLIVPHEWEEHQVPHDYFRYTRHGLRHLLAQAGLHETTLEPVGGYFRLLARRLLNGLQFFPGPVKLLAAAALVPPALVLPALDFLDRDRHFTLGFICVARK